MGAQVELEITECSLGGDGLLSHCVPTRVMEVDNLKTEESFEVVGHRAVDGRAFVTLLARSEGQSALEFRYRDDHGEEHEDRVELRAAHPKHVAVRASCEGDQTVLEDLALGVGSTFSVNLLAYGENGVSLATGELDLVDFGAFEVLERMGTQRTLRTPSTAGDQLWTSVAQESTTVTVFDATNVEFVAESASAVGSQVTLAASIPGKTVCTSAPKALAHVRVEGDCQVGMGGVIVADSLPLETLVGGSTFEVRGQGECLLTAEFAGVPVTEYHLTPQHAQQQAVGTALGTSPMRFDLYEPLPSATCDKGITDGKCEPLVWIIPDADCLTDADFSMEHFDSRGPIGKDYVGKSLTTSVALGVTVGPNNELIEGKRAPMDVTWSYDARLFGILGSMADAHVEIGECLPPGVTRLVHVRVDALGPQQIEFEASNINDTGELDFATRDVDHGRIEVQVDGETVSEPEWSIFGGSSVTLGARYERSDGLALRGDAPLEAQTDNPAGQARIATKGALFVGNAPAQLLIQPTIGSGGQRLNVVDESAAAALQASLMPAGAQVGEVVCLQLGAVDANGKLIRGTGSVAMTARVEGGEAWAVDPSTTSRSLCLRAVESAPANLVLSLGAASLAVTLPVATVP